jgi:hypothetical protein
MYCIIVVIASSVHTCRISAEVFDISVGTASEKAITMVYEKTTGTGNQNVQCCFSKITEQEQDVTNTGNMKFLDETVD